MLALRLKSEKQLEQLLPSVPLHVLQVGWHAMQSSGCPKKFSEHVHCEPVAIYAFALQDTHSEAEGPVHPKQNALQARHKADEVLK